MRRGITFLLAALTALLLLPSSALASRINSLVPLYVYTEGQFHDVAQDDWYTPYIAAAYSYGLARGDGSGEFLPAREIRFAEAVAMAARLHAVYRTGFDAGFDQSSGARWYDTYFDYAARYNLLEGIGKAEPELGARRWQVALLVMNALPSEAFITVNVVDNGAIPDVAMTRPYAAAVYTLYRAGVLTGTPPINAFEGEDIILRAEAVTILIRAVLPELRQTVSLRGPRDQYIQESLRLINELRRENGLATLALDDGLLMAATVRAPELQVSYAQERPDGSSYETAIDEAGVSYSRTTQLITKGQATPAALLSAFPDGALLEAQHGKVGISYYLSADGTPYWVILLCAS